MTKETTTDLDKAKELLAKQEFEDTTKCAEELDAVLKKYKRQLHSKINLIKE